MTRDRVLAWDGCVNVRDLGGLPLDGGGETRFRVVVRADSIGGLTEHGWTALQQYGVTTAVDLRGADERRDVAAPIPVVHVPIRSTTGPGWDWPSMREAYLALLDEFRADFARAVETVAAAEPPVVVHCQGGRDRTGLLVGLVLAAAGVDHETIAADHALSDDNWAPYHLPWFEQAGDPVERARRQRVAEPAGRTMAEVLAEVDRRYGGPAGYLETPSLDTIVLRLRP